MVKQLTDYEKLKNEFEQNVITAFRTCLYHGKSTRQAEKLTGIPKKTYFRYLKNHPERKGN
jgi:hypothetical protein